MPRVSRERWAAVGPGLIALACGLLALAASPSEAQTRAAPRPIPTRNQLFRIPFDIPPKDQGRIKEVRLYYSVDSGQTWEAAGRVDPSRGSFTFRAPRDAEYWFAVQTVDTQGRLFPPPEEPFRGPDMRVVVDTTPPLLRLTPIGRRGSRVGVSWEIRDEHLKPESLTIEYREEGARDWQSVPIRQKSLIGEQEWDARTAAPLLVHAWVDDQAGNRALVDLRIDEGIAAAPGPATGDLGNFEPPPPIAPIRTSSLPNTRREFVEPDGFADYGSTGAADFYAAGSPAAGAPTPRAYPPPTGVPENVRSLLVGSPTFALQYEVEDAGPEGPALVELWVTRDGGQTWSRQPEDADRRSPYLVNLEGEGTYGLWLVVQSLSGLGDPPPRPGDRPQLWVEVDSQPPVVRLRKQEIGVGTGPRLGQVRITWYASDSHLADKPVLLSYRADDANDRQWHPIAPPMDNTGEFIWNVPPEVPSRFHLRIDVRDSVGNRAYDETTPNGPILVDRSRPKGRILGLDPGAHAGDERQRR